MAGIKSIFDEFDDADHFWEVRVLGARLPALVLWTNRLLTRLDDEISWRRP
jgi:hypothetical protein